MKRLNFIANYESEGRDWKSIEECQNMYFSLSEDERKEVDVKSLDLKRNFFMKAWSHFARSNYERAFQTENLTLLKHEDGVWNIVEEYPLKNE